MSNNSINNALCQGCSLPITDQYLFKVLPDMQWHEQCLKCCECHVQLTETCFIRGNRAYCRADYKRLFGANVLMKQCDKCQQIINRNDLVMKSKEKTFHLDCFKCSVCSKKLAPGDEYCHQPELDMLYCKDDALITTSSVSSPKFSMNNNQLFLSTNRYQSSTMSITPENSSSCSFSPSTTSSSSSSSVTDSPISNYNTNMNGSFQSLNQSSMPTNYTNTMMQSNIPPRNHQFNEFEGNNSDSDEEDIIDDDNDESVSDEDSSFTESQKSKKKNKNLKKNCTKSNYNSSPDSLLLQINNQYNGNSQSGGSHSNKPARIRTVLNEKQLHTLRACYGANPRPDALMKEQLVEMTGLNPRVIRVWFQNKRCKDKKKNMLRPEHHQHQFPNPMQHHLNNVAQNGYGTNNQHLMFEHCF